MPGRKAIWQRIVRAARTEADFPAWEQRPGNCNADGVVECSFASSGCSELSNWRTRQGCQPSDQTSRQRGESSRYSALAPTPWAALVPAGREVSPLDTVLWPHPLGQLWYLHVGVQILGSLAHGAIAQHHHVSRFTRCV